MEMKITIKKLRRLIENVVEDAVTTTDDNDFVGRVHQAMDDPRVVDCWAGESSYEYDVPLALFAELGIQPHEWKENEDKSDYGLSWVVDGDTVVIFTE